MKQYTHEANGSYHWPAILMKTRKPYDLARIVVEVSNVCNHISFLSLFVQIKSLNCRSLSDFSSLQVSWSQNQNQTV
jgi:hypothetical protein